MNKLLLPILVLSLVACKSEQKKDYSNSTRESNTALDEEWISLFDNNSAKGWRAYNGKSLPPQWVVIDGVLTFETDKRLETDKKGGKDIVYAAEEFDNFELRWEWKIPEGGNSGILYHVQEGEWGPPEVAPEYQLLDDLKWEEINNASLEPWQKTGADYAMHVPDEQMKIVKPALQWNSSRIVFTEDKVEHWLNGKKLLEFQPWTADWEARKKAGKWKDFPNYGAFKKGFITIQDHDSPIWFRNMKIKKL